MAPVHDAHRLPRALAAPDAFKGTATAETVAAAVAAGAADAGWACDVCPLSDGGEGFADVVVAAAGSPGREPADAGHWVLSTVTGPLGRPVVARWFLGPTRAVIESAAASGLPLAGGAAGNDPVAATSRGTGELIAAAVAAGVDQVLVGVGGTASTDGGLGARQAIQEAGGLGSVDVVVACDVRTRFVDAAGVFGPQKGAGPAQVAVLRPRLEALADRYRRDDAVDVSALVGSGAGGGLAGGLAALGARLLPGFEVVAASVGLAGRIAAADLVVTGEGCVDASSWSGKVVGGVYDLAHAAGVTVLVVAGSVDPRSTAPGGTAPGGTAWGGLSPGLDVIDLSARFGPARARTQVARCVAQAVGDDLSDRIRGTGGLRRGPR